MTPAYPGLTGNIAVIHAKGTSERVPGKAMRPLGPWPLFVHAIKLAARCHRINSVVIDSDSPEIRAIGVKHCAYPLARPAELATNATAGDGLEAWAADNLPDSNLLVVIVPTSPFIRPASVDGAIGVLMDDADVNSVAGVHSEKLFRWENGRPAYGAARTGQEMPYTCWETTGLYVVRTRWAREHRQRIDYRDCVGYPLTALESIDINTPEDFELAEIVYRGLHTC